MSPVTSQSARVSRTRPFYARHAQAYDLLVADPVEPWVEAVHERLVRSGWPAASVLDAGCGTGRHAAALAALGYRVDLADAAGGLLFLDVREQRGSRDRADATPRRQTVQLAPDTRLDFTSSVTWHDGLLHVHEQYTLRAGQQPAHESAYDFAMRPWTEDELVRRLSAAGFHDIEIRPGAGRKTPDRLLVIATR